MSSGFRKVKPTKPNLDNLRKKRKFTDRGKHLLELKREQILAQFKSYVKEFNQQRKLSREKIIESYERLNKAYMGYGKRRIKTLAEINRIHYEPRVSTNYVNYMGIDIPKIKVDIFEKEKLPSYSFQDTPVDFDDTVDLIKQSFNEIMKLAELDYVIFHFAFNYQKIQRRINALEDILIPRISQDIHVIEEILEDLEREEFIRMREIKDNLEEKEINEIQKNNSKNNGKSDQNKKKEENNRERNSNRENLKKKYFEGNN